MSKKVCKKQKKNNDNNNNNNNNNNNKVVIGVYLEKQGGLYNIYHELLSEKWIVR